MSREREITWRESDFNCEASVRAQTYKGRWCEMGMLTHDMDWAIDCILIWGSKCSKDYILHQQVNYLPVHAHSQDNDRCNLKLKFGVHMDSFR